MLNEPNVCLLACVIAFETAPQTPPARVRTRPSSVPPPQLCHFTFSMLGKAAVILVSLLV